MLPVRGLGMRLYFPWDEKFKPSAVSRPPKIRYCSFHTRTGKREGEDIKKRKGKATGKQAS